MKGILISALLCVVALATSVSPAVAQEDGAPNALQPGAQSLSFRLPDAGTTAVGYWRMWSERTALGVVVDAGGRSTRAQSDDGTSTSRRVRLGVQPMLKRFLRTDSPVAPFLLVGAFANYHRTEDSLSASRGPVDGRALHLGLNLGGGVEWFPVSWISLGGRVGVQGGWVRGEGNSPGVSDERGTFLETYTTNVILQIYF